MKKLFFVIALIPFFVSCNTTPKEATITTEDSGNSNEVFFPVTSYLKGQMLELDSLPVTPLYIISKQNKEDSAWIKREELRPLLQTFFSPIIDSLNLIKYFKETKFNDLSLNSIIFTYEADVTLPDSIQINNWTIYINPDKGSISKVYIVKKIKEKNNTILQQLTWQTGKWAKINSLIIKDNGESELLKEEKIIWDLSEEEKEIDYYIDSTTKDSKHNSK